MNSKIELSLRIKEASTVLALLFGCFYAVILAKTLEYSVSYFYNLALISLIIWCLIINYYLSNTSFIKNLEVSKILLVKIVITVLLFSLIVPITNHKLNQELNLAEKIKINKNLQTILEISKENISENLSFSDKEKFENSINIIKNRMKNVSSHFTGRDLNITENILKELVIFKQKSDIKKQEKNLEQDTKELIKNMN